MRIGSRSWRHKLLAVASLITLGTSGCSEAVPEGTPIRNAQLMAILTPPGATSSELRRAKDGRCYFSAGPLAPELDAKSYLALLEDRGVRLRAMAGSPHNPVSTLNLYNFSIAVATSLDPLTIATASITDVDPREPSLFRALFRIRYSYPIRESAGRITVRLGPDCGERWRTETVLPKTDVAAVPFGIPRPANSILARAKQQCGPSVTDIAETLPKGCRVTLTFVSAVNPKQLAISWRRDVALFGDATEVLVRYSLVSTELTTGEHSSLRAKGIRRIVLKANELVKPEADFTLNDWPRLQSAMGQFRATILIIE